MALVTPAKTDHYSFAQSRHEQLPEIPFRAIIAAPSGAGKTVLLQSMILDLYKTKGGKSPFERIYIWSPSVHVDPAWRPVKEMIREKLGVDDEKEKYCYDRYKPEELEAVIDVQRKIIDAQKKRGDKKLFSILIVIDDYADNPSFTRQSHLALDALRARQALRHQQHQ